MGDITTAGLVTLRERDRERERGRGRWTVGGPVAAAAEGTPTDCIMVKRSFKEMRVVFGDAIIR